MNNIMGVFEILIILWVSLKFSRVTENLAFLVYGDLKPGWRKLETADKIGSYILGVTEFDYFLETGEVLYDE